MITIVVNKKTVSYRDENGVWLDGDHITLSEDIEQRITMDEWDLDAHNGDEIAAIVAYIRDRLDVISASSYPIGSRVSEHAWLSGSYTDPYRGDARVEETTVRVLGCTDEQRAEIFRRVCAR